jgi:hypothetical protein
VAQIVLQGSGIVPVVGQFVSTRMPQHVRMQWERHPGGLAEPLDEMLRHHAEADPYRGENSGPGKDDRGELDIETRN